MLYIKISNEIINKNNLFHEMLNKLFKYIYFHIKDYIKYLYHLKE